MGKCDKYYGKDLQHAACESWFHTNMSMLGSPKNWSFQAVGTPSVITYEHLLLIITAYNDRVKKGLLPEYKQETKHFIVEDLFAHLKSQGGHWVYYWDLKNIIAYALAELNKSTMGDVAGRARVAPHILLPLSVDPNDKNNQLNKEFEEDKEKRGRSMIDDLVDFAVSLGLVVAAGVSLYFIVKLVK